jgi:hypothetical protein
LNPAGQNEHTITLDKDVAFSRFVVWQRLPPFKRRTGQRDFTTSPAAHAERRLPLYARLPDAILADRPFLRAAKN